MKKVPLIAQIISRACALVAVGAVLLWAAPCAGSLELANGNMVPMRCAYTSKVAVLLALMLAVVCTAGLATRRPLAATVALLSAALILMTFDTPLSIGVAGGISLAAVAVGALANPNRKRIRA